MKRHGLRTGARSAPLELALVVGACAFLFGRGVFQLTIMLAGAAAAAAWWAFTSEP